MNKFVNLIDGELKVLSHKIPSAELTTQDLLFTAWNEYSNETLCASIDNELDLHERDGRWFAIFTGLTGQGKFAYEKEARDIEGDSAIERVSNALLVWGADIDETIITCEGYTNT